MYIRNNLKRFSKSWFEMKPAILKTRSLGDES